MRVLGPIASPPGGRSSAPFAKVGALREADAVVGPLDARYQLPLSQIVSTSHLSQLHFACTSLPSSPGPRVQQYEPACRCWVSEVALLRRLKKIGKYHELFGKQAPWILAKLATSRGITEVSVRPPGVSEPVCLRLRTSDVPTFRHVFFEREYALRLYREPRTIVDAGACTGLASVYFASRYPATFVTGT